MPAAPAPDITMRTSSSRLSTTCSALSRAARTTMAVPCWSSWKTGMSRRARSRCSTSKQRGAEMSSRLMPANTGAISSTVRTISSTSCVSRQIGKASMPAKRLNRAALPSMTGRAAIGTQVAEPEDGGAVGHHSHRVALDRQPAGIVGVLGQGKAHPRDPGRVDHREVVTVADRHLGLDLDLSPEVHEERAVGDLADRHPLHRGQRVGEPLRMLGVGGGAGDVDAQCLVPDAVTSRAVTTPPASSTACVSWLTALPRAGTSSRTVIE